VHVGVALAARCEGQRDGHRSGGTDHARTEVIRQVDRAAFAFAHQVSLEPTDSNKYLI
jgi:hypothetical protein